MAPRPSWRGYLRLSLVTCPVAMLPATSEASIHSTARPATASTSAMSMPRPVSRSTTKTGKRL
jgi:non-homologous end joining protein Ku